MRTSRRLAAASAAGVTVLAAVTTGCSVSGGGEDATGMTRTVVVASHDSWAMSAAVMRQFTRQTGYTVKIEPNGDAGQLTNKLVLTKGSPIADMTYGIDNTFASRAVGAGILAGYTPDDEPPSARAFEPSWHGGARALTPVDYGDVCVNVDDAWFREHHKAPPRTLDDLTRPAYRGLFVTPGASSSSPGLAFLLATIARYGHQWPSYWRKLVANDVKITAGWSDAWEVDYTAGGGHGGRPIVLSYASSIPDTIPKGGDRPTTHALLDTCFRQVEYAGVLKGARNPAGARAFIAFMMQRPFQEALPENMYVYPVDDRAPLPATWARFARTADHPFTVPPDQIAKHREEWLREWSDVTSR
jgi:thiamine transport system substrate-binding protein